MSENKNHYDGSVFEEIAKEIREEKQEIERIMSGKLEHTITCEELDKILVNAKHTVRLLKKVKSETDIKYLMGTEAAIYFREQAIREREEAEKLKSAHHNKSIVHRLSHIAEQMRGQQYGSQSNYTAAMTSLAEQIDSCIL